MARYELVIRWFYIVGGGMNSETITVTVKGVKHYFHGDVLTSAEQQAILFLKSIEKDPLDE
ncbi:MAG: hypothetical protein GY920_18910 [Aliivibrio sp.]|nr:hypothetical protein [Aliivibrio sp.]